MGTTCLTLDTQNQYYEWFESLRKCLILICTGKWYSSSSGEVVLLNQQTTNCNRESNEFESTGIQCNKEYNFMSSFNELDINRNCFVIVVVQRDSLKNFNTIIGLIR